MGIIGNDAMEMEPVATDNLGPLAMLILTDLPGCDDLVVRMKLGAALREFCRETNACTFTVRMLAKEGGVVPIPAAPNGMIVGTVLNVGSRDSYGVRFEVSDGIPPMIITNGVGEGEEVLVKFSAYPKAGGEACPEEFIERYAEAITAGAMHKLLTMTGRAWSDAQRAALYGAEYADAISEASYRSLGSAIGGGSESAIPQGGLFM